MSFSKLDTIRITEERDFTNPHVRFRRINGRIVPIFNRKRIGQDMGKYGDHATTAGAALAGAGVVKKALEAGAKRTGIDKGVRFGVRAARWLDSQPFAAKVRGVPAKRSSVVRGFGALGKVSWKAALTVARNPVKFGLGLAGTGLVSRALGMEMEMSSPFGKDFLFVKDEVNK